MNKIIHYALAAMLAAALPAVQADKPKTAAKSAKKEKAAGFVKQVREADLYGMWAVGIQRDKTILLNTTLIKPDHTAYDFTCVTDMENGTKIHLSQDITWIFNEAEQTVTEKITSSQTRVNGGEAENDDDKIGQSKTVKVQLRKLAGAQPVLKLTSGKDSMVYLKVPDDMVKQIHEAEAKCSGF